MSPSLEKIANEVFKYRSSKERELYGIYVEGTLIGIAGLIRGDVESELKHITIHPDHRGYGYGGCLIKGLLRLPNLYKLIAETDKDAVDFYSKMGFTTCSLGEKYPGIERFKCEVTILI
jgi:ribosomal protein S18 acetylase RimI-like enzyme